MKPRIRCGIIVCKIWQELTEVSGNWKLLMHYVRRGSEIHVTAAFSSYNGVVTPINMRVLKLTPDWRERVPRDGTI